jgi:hypothetical protein
MTFGEFFAAIGVDPQFIIAGGAGGTLRALSRRRIKIREILLSPVCGVLAAAYLTLPAVHYVRLTGWPVPEDDAQVVLASAFLIGTCAMWIADIVFALIARRLGFSQAAKD